MCSDHTVTLFFSFSELVLNIGIIPETIQYRTDKLYISDIFVSVQGHTVLLNVDSGIIYNDKQYEWSGQACSERTMERLTLCANNNSNAIQFELNSKVSLKVKRVLHTGKTYFNFYIENFVNLPKNCTGFLGMYNLCLQSLSSMINRLLSQLKIYNKIKKQKISHRWNNS